MSEYTPSTEHVRETYQWGENACGCCARIEEEDGEAFDRWLQSEHARIWDECVDAHEQVTNSGRRIDPLYMTRMNPYRAKGDA